MASMSEQTSQPGQKNKLWTKNFTIITLGTVVSMLGNSISGFAIGLMVLDYTNSTFLFALFMVTYSVPKIIMPMIAGPYLDNFSRTKVIYSLDFLSAFIYLGIFLLLKYDLFSYGPFLILCFLIGCIDSIYTVAYESLYPTLVSEGNYRKGYSISSMISPLCSVMVPVAAYLYDHNIGLQWLFLFNAASFFIAACCETQIKAEESHISSGQEKFSIVRFRKEFRDGLDYIGKQPGLKIITAYFFVSMFAFAASGTVVLPYFKAHPNLGMFAYTWVMGGGVVGKLAAGALQYRFEIPMKWKFTLSFAVYLIICALEGSYLYFPFLIMMGLCFLSGFLQVISYNIRVAATQTYVPNAYRGRFNGTFQMICTLGTIIGQLLCGALADFIGERLVLMVFMSINALAVLTVMLPGRRHVKAIYNRAV